MKKMRYDDERTVRGVQRMELVHYTANRRRRGCRRDEARLLILEPEKATFRLTAKFKYTVGSNQGFLERTVTSTVPFPGSLRSSHSPRVELTELPLIPLWQASSLSIKRRVHCTRIVRRGDTYAWGCLSTVRATTRFIMMPPTGSGRAQNRSL